MRCNRVSKTTGLRCRHDLGHAGPHEPGTPEPADLDDPSDDVLEMQERRDGELRREEAL